MFATCRSIESVDVSFASLVPPRPDYDEGFPNRDTTMRYGSYALLRVPPANIYYKLKNNFFSTFRKKKSRLLFLLI
jgi:hypothetical protein